MLSTNLAESSLTIEGVRLVVDSGLRRASAYDPAVGMSALVTRPISIAAPQPHPPTPPPHLAHPSHPSHTRNAADIRYLSPALARYPPCLFTIH